MAALARVVVVAVLQASGQLVQGTGSACDYTSAQNGPELAAGLQCFACHSIDNAQQYGGQKQDDDQGLDCKTLFTFHIMLLHII